MRKWWLGLVCAAGMSIAACGDDGCSREELVAVDVTVLGGPFGKVTVELEEEEECASFVDPDAGRVYTCYEQGGGLYTVRVYSGETVVGEEQIEIEADACHIKERASITIELNAD